MRLEGQAVRSLTAAFLEMWNSFKDEDKSDKEFDKYLPLIPHTPKVKGFVQPYAISPLDTPHIGEEIYMSMAERAQEYLYIVTPYLIITDEMNQVLSLAAKRGVDVRIITPGIPDKKLVYSITKSFYKKLVKNGVRIYEYTPGFCHAKQCVSDDVVAICGTINFDYRSLYHHFENACLMANVKAVADIKADFEQLFPQSDEVTDKYLNKKPGLTDFIQMIIRLFAPLI